MLDLLYYWAVIMFGLFSLGQGYRDLELVAECEPVCLTNSSPPGVTRTTSEMSKYWP